MSYSEWIFILGIICIVLSILVYFILPRNKDKNCISILRYGTVFILCTFCALAVYIFIGSCIIVKNTEVILGQVTVSEQDLKAPESRLTHMNALKVTLVKKYTDILEAVKEEKDFSVEITIKHRDLDLKDVFTNSKDILGGEFTEEDYLNTIDVSYRILGTRN